MQQPTLDTVFSALSDATRRAIIARLSGGEATLSDLADPFDMSLTAVSKHVRVLSDAGIVELEKRGRTRHCRLTAENMKQAADWLSDYSAFWTAQFDSLGAYLQEEKEQE